MHVDSISRVKAVRGYGPRLPDAVRAILCLDIEKRRPVCRWSRTQHGRRSATSSKLQVQYVAPLTGVEDNNRVSRHEIESDAPSPRREQKAQNAGISGERIDAKLPLGRRRRPIDARRVVTKEGQGVSHCPNTSGGFGGLDVHVHHHSHSRMSRTRLNCEKTRTRLPAC